MVVTKGHFHIILCYDSALRGFERTDTNERSEMKYLAISSVYVLVDGLFKAVGHEAEDPPDLGAGGRQKPH